MEVRVGFTDKFDDPSWVSADSQGRGMAMTLGLARRFLHRVRGVKPAIEDGRPTGPVLQLDSPCEGTVAAGLLPISGWGFAPEGERPEGIVELAIDDEDQWVELKCREHVGGVPAEAQWARRGGFHSAVNTFFLSNDPHTLKLRLKTDAGRVIAFRELPVRVDNVGRLAETSAKLLRAHPAAQRVWGDVIDSEHFPYEAARGVAWTEQPDAESRIPEILARHGLAASYEEHLRHFLREGFLVLEDFIPKTWCDEINADLDSLIGRGVLAYKHKGQRVEHLFKHSTATRNLWAHPEILKLLSAIYDDVALPCQTLNFIHGSQQDVHQDLIHLTPFPAGMMCGVWVALEDVHPDSGPLVVYPGSHRLPRLYARTVPVDKVRDGNWVPFGSKYTPRLRKLIEDAGLKPHYYTPKAGSVLIWHEVLAHGGSPRNNDELTRKSVVSHYFARGGMAYYDSTGLPGCTHED